MKFLGLIIAGALAAVAQSAAAAVIFMPAGTSQTTLQNWGDPRTMAVQANPFTAGPLQAGSGVTYHSTNASSVLGYTGDYNFGPKPAWSAGGVAMAGLNAAEGAMTFDFDTPVAAVVAELNWAPGYANGQPIFISIYNAANELLETFQLSDGADNLLDTGFYGFSRDNADISRIVMTNGYIGARNFYTRAVGGGSGAPGFGASVLVADAPVPEPATWALMIMGFGSAGAMLRRRRLAYARA